MVDGEMVAKRIGLCAVAAAAAILARLSCTTADGDGIVAYEIKGRIQVNGSGPKAGRVEGAAPAVSPTANEVAFLREGNVYVLSRTGRAVQLTKLEAVDQSKTNSILSVSLSWHPSARYLAFARPCWLRYDRRRNRLVPTRLRSEELPDVDLFDTIWLADRRTGRARQVVAPTGDLRRMDKTGQLEGASVCLPVFSPDGKSLWFVNAGWLYEVPIDAPKLSATAKPRLVARIGEGLDYASPGASKWGTGAQSIAWDHRNDRLIFWIGRFWGSGESDYGYITWRNGKWGKPTACKPPFSPEIERAHPNIQRCAIDDHANLWVYAHLESLGKFVWTRADGRERLPVGADAPAWQPSH